MFFERHFQMACLTWAFCPSSFPKKQDNFWRETLLLGRSFLSGKMPSNSCLNWSAWCWNIPQKTILFIPKTNAILREKQGSLLVFMQFSLKKQKYFGGVNMCCYGEEETGETLELGRVGQTRGNPRRKKEKTKGKMALPSRYSVRQLLCNSF